MPVSGVRHLVQIEQLQCVDQSFGYERRAHSVQGLAMGFGVLHAKVVVVEGRAPLLKSQRFSLIEIHETASLYKYWFHVQ